MLILNIKNNNYCHCSSKIAITDILLDAGNLLNRTWLEHVQCCKDTHTHVI